ncbi:uncharacterized protein EV154DRAFT_561125 [Mucor mucedo]|uniref:uncharacterized protein n=1 Tax=Mucor mucedo TaxID=29922 RepID=UPI0022201938|nr:uncharacterized protein EV154DRAFT_561125 [Mucor mucedo]KAI7893619.1 hypothetical protein EV154DRAFT_561125 [Mucor mucedo]
MISLQRRFEEGISSWNQFNKVHNQTGAVLAEKVREAHRLVYHSIHELHNQCDRSIHFLNEINVEFKVAKATKNFDMDELEELMLTMTKMLDQLEIKRCRDKLISKQLDNESVQKIKAEKDKINYDRDQVNQKTLKKGKYVGSVTVGGLSTVATDFFGTINPLYFGSACLAAFSIPILIAAVQNCYGKMDCKKIDKNAQDLLSKMNGLQKDFVCLQLEINGMSSEIENYVLSISKCMNYTCPDDSKNKAHRIRVKKMAKNMILSTEALKNKFVGIRDMARQKEKELQSMLLNHEPLKLLLNPHEPTALLLEQ